MNKLNKLIFVLTMAGVNSAYAKSIGPGLNKLNSSLRNDLGLACVGIAVTIAGVYIVFGKKEGMEKFSNAILGAVIIAFASSIAALVWSAGN
jgi:type IV secretory pathway VirB2 component (pilin)